MSHRFLTSRQAAADAILSAPSFEPAEYRGRGIVICGGGETYFSQAWVLIRMLRARGCRLPIELWHKGPHELSPRMRELVEPYGVDCRDAFQMCLERGVSRLFGWTIKPLSILYAKFREVLYIDADNVPTRDPQYLFDEPLFEQHGSLFWTDRFRGGNSPHRSVRDTAWEICNVPQRDEPEFETGQLLVDKSRTWNELQLTLHFNQCADVYYEHLYGDKDTFRMAWHRLGRPYGEVPFGPSSPPHFGVLYQLDPSGSVVFQHRARSKWKLGGPNRRVPGFQGEELCLKFLDELAGLWDGTIESRGPGDAPNGAAERSALTGEPCECWIEGEPRGQIRFHPDGTLEAAPGRIPNGWELELQPNNGAILALRDDSSPPVYLHPSGPKEWSGRWVAGMRRSLVLRFAASDEHAGSSTSIPTSPAAILVSSPQGEAPVPASESSSTSAADSPYPDDNTADVAVAAPAARSPYPTDLLTGEPTVQLSSYPVDQLASYPADLVTGGGSASEPVASQGASIRALRSSEPASDSTFVRSLDRLSDPRIVNGAPGDANRSEEPREIKIYGLPRTCTNLLTVLLRRNYLVNVYSNELGWKHGPNLYRQGDTIDGAILRFAVCVKHPYSWLVSLYRFDRRANDHRVSFREFVRGQCRVYNGRNPIEMYNLLNRMWMGLAVDPGLVRIVRSEDLQTNQTEALQRLESTFGLVRTRAEFDTETNRVGPDEQIRNRAFDLEWYRRRKYLEFYDEELLEYVDSRIDGELMERFGYSTQPDAAPPVAGLRSSQLKEVSACDLEV